MNKNPNIFTNKKNLLSKAALTGFGLAVLTACGSGEKAAPTEVAVTPVAKHEITAASQAVSPSGDMEGIYTQAKDLTDAAIRLRKVFGSVPTQPTALDAQPTIAPLKETAPGTSSPESERSGEPGSENNNPQNEQAITWNGETPSGPWNPEDNDTFVPLATSTPQQTTQPLPNYGGINGNSKEPIEPVAGSGTIDMAGSNSSVLDQNNDLTAE